MDLCTWFRTASTVGKGRWILAVPLNQLRIISNSYKVTMHSSVHNENKKNIKKEKNDILRVNI